MVAKSYCNQQQTQFLKPTHVVETQSCGSKPKRQRINANEGDDEGNTYSEIQYQDAGFDSDYD